MLDFYLFGLARSGTTACCHALNLHPDIYCGVERFQIGTHPKGIEGPESYIDDSIPGNKWGIKDANLRLTPLLSDRAKLPKYYGDKLPRKFYFPAQLASVSYNICIYRPYHDVIHSWNARATNKADKDWSEFRTGYLFFFDLFIFMMVVSDLPDVCVINYPRLFYQDYENEISLALSTIGAPFDQYPLEKFRDKFYQKRHQKPFVELEERYKHLADFIGLDDFEDRFFNQTPSGRVEAIKEYAKYIKSNKDIFYKEFCSLLSHNEVNGLLHVFDLLIQSGKNEEIMRYFPEHLFSIPNFLYSYMNDRFSVLKTMATIFPRSYLVHLEMSRLYKENNELEKAIAEAMTAIDLAPSLPGPHMQLSHIYNVKGEMDKAISEVEKAIDLKSDNPYFHHQLGIFLKKAGYKAGADAAQRKGAE